MIKAIVEIPGAAGISMKQTKRRELFGLTEYCSLRFTTPRTMDSYRHKVC